MPKKRKPDEDIISKWKEQRERRPVEEDFGTTQPDTEDMLEELQGMDAFLEHQRDLD